MITPYPDQSTSIESVADMMRRGFRAVLLQGATGSGKSIIALAIIERAMKKQKTVWFVVPRRELLKQMAETFNNFDLQYSFIAAGYSYNPYSQAHICSVGTLQGRLARLKAPMLAILDETHYGGDGLDKIIKWLKANGTWIIGLSATPWKMSGAGMKMWYDEMIQGPTIRWLIDNKRLADYRAFAPSHIDLSGIKITGGEFAKGQLAEKMEGDRVLIGNAVAHYKKHAMGKLGVTFGVSRKHSEMLAQAYRDAGIPAMHIDGETPDDERKRIAVAFAKRELLQLCNCDLLNMGYDLSSASGIKNVNIQCLTDCKPTKSLSGQLQKNGRNLRYDPEPHIFFDHSNNFQEHGLPCQDRVWSLEDREKTGRGGGERTLPVRQCPTCYRCHAPAPVCPSCGFVYPIEGRQIKEVEGELSEVQIEQIAKTKRMEVGSARSVDDLKKIAEERGYKRGWIMKQMQLKGIHA